MSNQTVTSKIAVLFLADTRRHTLNSSFLLGDLIHKDEHKPQDITVHVFHKENKKQVEDIMNKLKIPSINIKYSEAKGSLLEKVEEVATVCVKNECHVIAMPNTVGDLNENPKEISELVGRLAYEKCNNVTNSHVLKTYKPKDEKDYDDKIAKHRVQPFFKFQFMDDEYIEDNKTEYGLGEYFKEEQEQKVENTTPK